MAPKGKPDPNAVTWLTLRCRGGDNSISGGLAPKVGPLGLSPKKLADDIAKITANFTGLSVTVNVRIQNRQTEISIIPSAATLVIAALKEKPKKKGDPNRVHDGSISFNDVLDIARTMRARSLARSFTGTVKEILGTCVSVGNKVDGKNPGSVLAEITAGTLKVPSE